MEILQEFTEELSSLQKTTLPISKGKIRQITLLSILGIKKYKLIVHAVEKFAEQCEPKYKLSCVYVVDSIIRESKELFGADKDVYGSRFSKHIEGIFRKLLEACPVDDKPKIIRVLNLWLKDGLFSPQVIEPLLSMTSQREPSTPERPRSPPMRPYGANESDDDCQSDGPVLRHANRHFQTLPARSRSRSRSPVHPVPKLRPLTLQDREAMLTLPTAKPEHMIICSSTLWIGGLQPSVTLSDLREIFSKFGRLAQCYLKKGAGCAYVCMENRPTAVKTYMAIRRYPVILGQKVMIGWAPGHGMKDHEYKEYWNKDIGCSYIPYHLLKGTVDLTMMAENGQIDEDTIPEWLKEKSVSGSTPQGAQEWPCTAAGAAGLLSKRNAFTNEHSVPICPMMPVQPLAPPLPVQMSFPALSGSPLSQVMPVAAWNRVSYTGVTQHMPSVHHQDPRHAHHQAQAAQHQQHLQQQLHQEQWFRDQMVRWVANNPQLVLREEPQFMDQGKMMEQRRDRDQDRAPPT